MKKKKRRKHRKDDSLDLSSSDNSDSSNDSHYRHKRRKNKKHCKKDPIRLCATFPEKFLTTAYKSKIIRFKMDGFVGVIFIELKIKVKEAHEEEKAL